MATNANWIICTSPKHLSPEKGVIFPIQQMLHAHFLQQVFFWWTPTKEFYSAGKIIQQLQQISGIQENPSPRQSSIWGFAKNSYIINSFKHISRQGSEKKFRFDAIASEFTKNQIFLLTPLKKVNHPTALSVHYLMVRVPPLEVLQQPHFYYQEGSQK